MAQLSALLWALFRMDLNALILEYLQLAHQGHSLREAPFCAEIITNLSPEVGYVNLAPQEMGRVFLNLFINAFYAVHQRQLTGSTFQPQVWVSTQRPNGYVEIQVGDNGIGIPGEVVDKIFQPFFTTKPTGEGTGLGLSLSYDIVTKGHDGELTVVSRPGELTKFTIQLPCST